MSDAFDLFGFNGAIRVCEGLEVGQLQAVAGSYCKPQFNLSLCSDSTARYLITKVVVLPFGSCHQLVR